MDHPPGGDGPIGSLVDAVHDRPRTTTALVSAVGYALVFGTFGGIFPFPTLADATVVLLGDAIAVTNAVALTAIVVGVVAIKRGQIARHRAAMCAAFVLILIFLIMYLLKIGGGFEKSIRAEGLVALIYFIMLAVHILLSALAVPVVVHAVVLGISHTTAELKATEHATVGRVAVAAWATSLALGLLTYVLLNHVYGWDVHARAALLVFGVPAGRFADDRFGR